MLIVKFFSLDYFQLVVFIYLFVISPATVRDLGILIDADLSMRSHLQRTVAGCFAVLRQLRSVRRSVPSSVFQTLIVSLVLMKMATLR